MFSSMAGGDSNYFSTIMKYFAVRNSNSDLLNVTAPGNLRTFYLTVSVLILMSYYILIAGGLVLSLPYDFKQGLVKTLSPSFQPTTNFLKSPNFPKSPSSIAPLAIMIGVSLGAIFLLLIFLYRFRIYFQVSYYTIIFDVIYYYTNYHY